MKNGQFGNLNSLVAELSRQEASKRDVVLATEALSVKTIDGISHFTTGRDGVQPMPMTSLCRNQVASRVGIPSTFATKLIEQDPDLFDHMTTELFHRYPQQRMVRTLDGQARAFLSDRYKRIDNMPVLQTIDPILGSIPGVQLSSCDVTNDRMYIKITSPRLQGDLKVGDPVQMGLVISNSEVGLGALSIRALIYRLVCANGMISGSDMGEGIRRTHLGARQLDGVLLAEDTIQISGRAMALELRDTVKQLLSPETFQKHLDAFKATQERRITGDPAKAIDTLVRQFSELRQADAPEIMRHLIDSGEGLTQFGLLNAVTRFAQDVDSYDRSTELEAVGGKILTMPANSWRVLAEAA